MRKPRKSRKQAPEKSRGYESALRASAKDSTRDALLEAALGLFSERGLDAPSIGDICDRAGYSRGAFYAHFPDRDALVVEAMKARRRVTFDGLLATAGDGLSVGALVELIGSLVAAGAFPSKEGVRSPEFLQACRRSDELRRAHLGLLNGMTDRLAERVRRDQESGGTRRDIDPRALGALLVVLEAGVEVMADLGWDYDVVSVVKTLSRVLA